MGSLKKKYKVKIKNIELLKKYLQENTTGKIKYKIK